MMVRRVLLENIYSHEKTEVGFGRGLTAIVGPNGAGKSSIVEAILLALFDRGAQLSQEVVRTGKSKRGVVRVGAARAAVELEFEAGGRVYRVRREYDGEGNSRNHVLEEVRGGSGRVLARGVAEVTDYIASNILGAREPGVFTSTIFSRQDMLTQILDMSPRERWERVLRLLGLEDLDRAREAASDAANRAERMLSEISRDEAALKEIREKLARDRLEALKLGEELSSIDKKISEAEARREGLEARILVLREYIEKSGKLADLEARLRELGTLEEELGRIRERLKAFEAIGLSYDSLVRLYGAYKRSQQCGERYSELEERLKAYRGKAEGLLKGSEELGALARGLSLGLEGVSEEALDRVRALHEDLSRRLGEVRGAIALYTRLLELKPEAGRCPFCGRELEAGEAEHILERHRGEVERLKGEEARLSRMAGDARKLYKALEDSLSKAREYSSKAEELSRELESVRRCAEEGYAICSKVSEAVSKMYKSSSGSCGELLEGLVRELGALVERAKAAEERLRELGAMGARERASELRRELGEIVDRNPWLREVSDYGSELRRAEEEAKKLQALIEELKRRRGSVEGDLSRLEKVLREREEKALELEKRVSMKQPLERSLKVLRILGEKVFGRDGALSQALTQIIAKRLEEEVNRALEAFSRGFRVSIEGDFSISVEAPGGVLLGVGSLSGGERTMLAIAFRIALARILLGRLPGLMILDEPTQNLDAENKARLFEIVKEIAGILDQVVVVTHDEEIIEKADAIVRVYNRGGVSKV